MSWNEEKVKKLKELWGKGSTASQIAEIIGDVSRNAVIGKAHRLSLSTKIKNSKSTDEVILKGNSEKFQKTKIRGRRNKFRSLLIEKNFEPARNLTLEELTEETCKYMEHDVHPNEPNATFCGRKTISNSKQKLLDVTKKCLEAGIYEARPGNTIGDIGNAIQNYAEANGFGVVRELVGHGIGEKLHEEPQIPNFGKKGSGPTIESGMCFAIEPMINLGSEDVYTKQDGWTVCTKDKQPSAHFEHTITITNDGPRILTI